MPSPTPAWTRLVLSICVALLALPGTTRAQTNATWSANPANGNWFTAANWAGGVVPNGVDDTATFGASSTTAIVTTRVADFIHVNTITFAPAAGAYTIFGASNPLGITGTGIVNNSGIVQNFVNNPGQGMAFANAATTGSMTSFTNDGGTAAAGAGSGVEDLDRDVPPEFFVEPFEHDPKPAAAEDALACLRKTDEPWRDYYTFITRAGCRVNSDQGEEKGSGLLCRKLQ